MIHNGMAFHFYGSSCSVIYFDLNKGWEYINIAEVIFLLLF